MDQKSWISDFEASFYLNFNKEFNKGQDRGLEVLDFRFLSLIKFHKGKFHKELNKGKDLDSKIQKIQKL